MRALLACAILLLPITAHANGPEIGIDAGMVVPLESKDVELLAEWVDIYAPIEADSGRLECGYRLHNTSTKPVRLRMGFLVNSPSMSPRDIPLHWDDPDLGLRVHDQVGVPIAVHLEPVRARAWERVASAMPDSLPVWTVEIPARDTIALSITSRITWSGGSDGDSHGIALTYAARPARLWKGPIGQATIAFHFGNRTAALLRAAAAVSGDSDGWEPGTLSARITPPGFTWTWDGVRWTFDHWEPEEDPKVSIDWTDPATDD